MKACYMTLRQILYLDLKDPVGDCYLQMFLLKNLSSNWPPHVATFVRCVNELFVNDRILQSQEVLSQLRNPTDQNAQGKQ